MTFEEFKKLSVKKYEDITLAEDYALFSFVDSNAASEVVQHYVIESQEINPALKKDLLEAITLVDGLDATHLATLAIKLNNLDCAYSILYNAEILSNKDDLFKMVFEQEKDFKKAYTLILTLEDEANYKYVYNVIDKAVATRDWSLISTLVKNFLYSKKREFMTALREKVHSSIHVTEEMYEKEIKQYDADGKILNCLKLLKNTIRNEDSSEFAFTI